MKKIHIILLALVLLFAAVSCNEASDTSRSWAIGKIGGSMADASARQPESTPKIQSAASIGYYYIDKAFTGYNAIGIGQAGSSTMDAIARQPENTPNIVFGFINNCEFIVSGKEALKCESFTSDELASHYNELKSNARSITNDDFIEDLLVCLEPDYLVVVENWKLKFYSYNESKIVKSTYDEVKTFEGEKNFIYFEK